MFRNRQAPASRFVNACSTPGAAAMNEPGVARRPPAVDVHVELPLQDVERIRLVRVGVRLRAFERPFDRELEDGEVRQRRLHDRDAVPRRVAQELALTGAVEDAFRACGDSMSFASRDAFPARGGVGDERPVRGARRSPGAGSGTAPYVELHAHSAYSFLDGASLPEELAARAAELGYDALALTDHDGVYGSLEFAHAAKHFGVRPITGAEVTLAGGAHVTLLCETPARLREPLPHPHRRARGHARPRPGARAAAGRDDGRGRRDATPKGSSRSPAARGTGSPWSTRTPQRGSRARFPARSTSSCSARTSAATRDGTRALVELAEHARRADRRDRRRARAQPIAAHGCRTHSSRSSTARRSTAASANGAATTRQCCSRRRRCSSACRADAAARTREVADRCTFDLTQELGYRYPDFSDGVDPADRQLRAICDRAFAERYADANGLKKRARRAARRRARADRAARASRVLPAPLGGARARPRVRARGARARQPRHALPPGRGRGSSVGSIVCYLTGLSHVDPVEADLSLGRFINDEMVAVPDIDLDFPRDIREKLIVARHRALRPRARSARRDVRDLPQPRRDPRRRQGARAAVRRARNGSHA